MELLTQLFSAEHMEMQREAIHRAHEAIHRKYEKQYDKRQDAWFNRDSLEHDGF